MDKNTEGCSYKQGTLPSCAPLALAYVPMQESSKPAYEPCEALKRGTLFPGLDLPFMNIVNTADLDDTPLCEVMTLNFAAHELHLYLDTHPNDAEAFETLKNLLALCKEAHKRYIEKYGPLKPSDLMYMDKFNWLCDPWPWNYQK